MDGIDHCWEGHKPKLVPNPEGSAQGQRERTLTTEASAPREREATARSAESATTKAVETPVARRMEMAKLNKGLSFHSLKRELPETDSPIAGIEPALPGKPGFPEGRL
jgi:ribosome-binding protein aMBF1 (putative translation factor)